MNLMTKLLLVVTLLLNNLSLLAGDIAPMDVAPTDVALTLGQVTSKSEGHLDTLLILKASDQTFSAINLSEYFGSHPDDPLALIANHDYSSILAVAAKADTRTYSLAELKISPAIGTQHIAAGTNYLAHREEAQLDAGFLFPKYSPAGRFNAQVKTSDVTLLDYEVELCVRFDRDVSSAESFESAVKGFFVCGDMTDRAELLRRVDVDDITSGRGFTDGKSGSDRFPIGPYTLVAKDWHSFVEQVVLETWVNGELRQQSGAAKMVKPIDALVADALRDGLASTWVFQQKPIPLLADGLIKQGMVLISGTPEGVIYQGISTADKIMGSLSWIFSGAFMDRPMVSHVIETVIKESLASKQYLQPGDRVVLGGTYLGEIKLKVVDG